MANESTGRRAAGLGDVSLRVAEALAEDPTGMRTALGVGAGAALSVATLEVSGGLLRINGETGSYRQIQFGGPLAVDETNVRWSVHTSSTAEAGGNAGSDFRVVRYSDTGVALDAPLVVKRSTGYIGVNVGGSTPAARLDVQTDGTVEGVFVKGTAAGTADVAVLRLESSAAGKRIVDYRVTGDAVSRLRVDTSAGSGSGTLTFGDGVTADTNLYRSTAAVLATDASFFVGSNLRHFGTGLGFYGAAAGTKPSITGSRAGNAALASLLTQLATLGLVTDSTTG